MDSTEATDPRDIFPFLRLPAEIRMMVYNYLLTYSGSENVTITTMLHAQKQTLGPHRRSQFGAQSSNPTLTYTRTRHWCGDGSCRDYTTANSPRRTEPPSLPTIPATPTRPASFPTPDLVSDISSFSGRTAPTSRFTRSGTAAPKPYSTFTSGRLPKRNPRPLSPRLYTTSPSYRMAELVSRQISMSGINQAEPRRAFHTCCDLLSQLHPAILSTCRQICSEATPCLYAERTFVLSGAAVNTDTRAGITFLRGRGPQSSLSLRSVSLQVSSAMWDIPAWDLLCTELAYKCKELEKLEVVMDIGDSAEQPLPSELTCACRALNESDVRLLVDMSHPWFEWTASLSKIRGIKVLDVVSSYNVQANAADSDSLDGIRQAGRNFQGWPARTHRTLAPATKLERNLSICLLFPESIDEGVAGFLRKQLGIPPKD